MSGAGGWAQSLVNGFAGLRYRSDGVHLKPTILPNVARRMKWRSLRYRGIVFELEAWVGDSSGDGDDDPGGVQLCVLHGTAVLWRRPADGPPMEQLALLRAPAAASSGEEEIKKKGREGDDDDGPCAVFGSEEVKCPEADAPCHRGFVLSTVEQMKEGE